MNEKRLIRLAMIMLFVGAVSACEFSFSTANIKNVTLAKGVNDNKEPVNATTVFSTEDQIIHCVVELGNAPDDTKLRARWTVVKVEGAEPNQKIAETDIAAGGGKNIVDFTLTPSGDGLPPGDYKVDIFLNPKTTEESKPEKTLTFSVR